MRPMLTCREVEDFILSYLEGTLPMGRLVLFRLHLMMCKECRAYIRSYQIANQAAVQTFTDPDGDADAAEVPPRLIAAILAARGREPES